MKNKIITLALILGIISARATDLTVEESGFGGSFTTIQAAINAAVNGDRIIIIPRAANATYNESLNNGSKNIQLLSSLEGTRWRLSGNITEAGNSTFQIYGGDISGLVSEGVNGTIRMAGCKLNGYVNGSPTGYLYLDNDTINLTNQIYIYGGRVSGCYIVPTNSSNLFTVYLPNGGAAGNDTIMIVGNTIDGTTAPNSNYPLIECQTTSRYTYVANNLLIAPLSNFYGFVESTYLKANGVNRNAIINNTCINTRSGTFGNQGFFFNTTPSDLRFCNNIAYRPAGNYNNPMFYFFNGVPTVCQYNYVKTVGSPWTTTPDATNVGASNAVVDPVTGVLQAGSDAINGGDPNASYLDLDLSRNDAGCYGGSYNLTNFITTPLAGARVLFMNTPRSAFSNQTIRIIGEGLDK